MGFKQGKEPTTKLAKEICFDQPFLHHQSNKMVARKIDKDQPFLHHQNHFLTSFLSQNRENAQAFFTKMTTSLCL